MRQAKRVAFVTLLSCAWGSISATTLYDEKTFRAPAADHKAFRRGDAITVQVYEDARASSNADTTTRRKNNLSAALVHGRKTVGGTAAVNGDFDGGGSTERAGKLIAQLSVSVVDVLPNGELQVAGRQLLVVNGEEQRIAVEGRVRPQDISDTNVVLSTRLADARITYQGDGELSERQKRGWWRNIADKLGL
jgi:flagellar L-ring protein precursor FlgH